MQSTATFLPADLSWPMSASTNVLFPAPGGPVIPMTLVAELAGSDCNSSSKPSVSFSIMLIALAIGFIFPCCMSLMMDRAIISAKGSFIQMIR